MLGIEMAQICSSTFVSLWVLRATPEGQQHVKAGLATVDYWHRHMHLGHTAGFGYNWISYQDRLLLTDDTENSNFGRVMLPAYH